MNKKNGVYIASERILAMKNIDYSTSCENCLCSEGLVIAFIFILFHIFI